MPRTEPDETIDLWPGEPPGRLRPEMTEIVENLGTRPGELYRRTQGIARPRLAVFRAANPNGGAMLIIPGGGLAWNYFDHEGYQVADLLTELGITCFVLFYRLAMDGWDNRASVGQADAQRAMRVIRHVAPDYRLDPARVGVVGFSAGGYLTASLLTRSDHQFYAPLDIADELDSRPMFAAPIYAVQSLEPAVAYTGAADALFGRAARAEEIAAYSFDCFARPGQPPCFLVHAEDDDVVPVANSTRLRDAMAAAGNKVETHLFATGGHGFGMVAKAGAPYSIWPQLFVAFAQSQGLFEPTAG